MKTFILLFRQPACEHTEMKPEKVLVHNQKWQDWLKCIANEGKLVRNSSHLSPKGKVLKPGGLITDGPFVEIKEQLEGFIKIKAADLEEAVTIAHGCPVIDFDGSVEIRPII